MSKASITDDQILNIGRAAQWASDDQLIAHTRALLSAQPAAEPLNANLVATSALNASEAAETPDSEEDAFVIDKLAKLLAGVCIALKGPEIELHRHSYHDIVEVSEAIKLELDLYRAQAASQEPTGEQL